MKVFYSKKSKAIANKIVLAIGGGKIIDEAKIYAKRHNKICIAIPTTGAGASETSHAVVWTKKEKKNIATDIPISITWPGKIKLNDKARRNTMADILGHVVDYMNVCSDNELIDVGRFAGKLIEQHPTNLTHPRSYHLTLNCGMTHGEAVAVTLCPAIRELFTQ